MSRQNKRKHVMNEALWADYQLPERNHCIVKVLRSMGNNLHMVINPRGEEFLVSMPPKFRKVIWVKRGDYLLVEPIPEGRRVKAEIVKILNKESIQFYKEKNVWPEEFNDRRNSNRMDDDEEKDDMFELFENININGMDYSSESSDDSSIDSGISDEDMCCSAYNRFNRL